MRGMCLKVCANMIILGSGCCSCLCRIAAVPCAAVCTTQCIAQVVCVRADRCGSLHRAWVTAHEWSNVRHVS